MYDVKTVDRGRKKTSKEREFRMAGRTHIRPRNHIYASRMLVKFCRQQRLPRRRFSHSKQSAIQYFLSPMERLATQPQIRR